MSQTLLISRYLDNGSQKCEVLKQRFISSAFKTVQIVFPPKVKFLSNCVQMSPTLGVSFCDEAQKNLEFFSFAATFFGDGVGWVLIKFISKSREWWNVMKEPGQHFHNHKRTSLSGLLPPSHTFLWTIKKCRRAERVPSLRSRVSLWD